MEVLDLEKQNALLNLINYDPDIENIYLYTKDPYKAKYQILINKRESTGLKYLDHSKAFIEHSNDLDYIYKNIEEYNPNKKRKILIIFDDVIGDMLSNKKLNPTLTELFIRGRKLIISLVFVTQSYFAAAKNIRLNSTYYFIIKIPNKIELQQIAFNHRSDIDFQDFMNLYKKSTTESYYFFVIDTTLPSDNSSRFRKNLLETIQIEQAKLTYSPLGKAFEKQRQKQLKSKKKKQVDAISNQNKRLEALANKDDCKTIYREIFDKAVKKRHYEIK